jgi:hypothetical protein
VLTEFKFNCFCTRCNTHAVSSTHAVPCSPLPFPPGPGSHTQDLKTNREHCGKCGNLCPPGIGCNNGKCAAPRLQCSNGLKQCDNKCVVSSTVVSNKPGSARSTVLMDSSATMAQCCFVVALQSNSRSLSTALLNRS